jgi:hypothetical protein
MWQFCICQEGFLKGELDLIQKLVSRYGLAQRAALVDCSSQEALFAVSLELS